MKQNSESFLLLGSPYLLISDSSFYNEMQTDSIKKMFFKLIYCSFFNILETNYMETVNFYKKSSERISNNP